MQINSTYAFLNEFVKVTKWYVRMSGILIHDVLHNLGIVNDVFEILMPMSFALQNVFDGLLCVA